ncbi:MAG: response regulator [Duncaniella sp.]|nr:response regulator [Duncaniella sp.]
MATAARKAAARHGIHPYIIGIDAAPEIGMKAVADSIIDATFVYPTDGYRLVRTALAIHRGEPYEARVILPVPSAVDLSNVNILLQQNESLREETSKVEGLKIKVDDYWRHETNQRVFIYLCLAILVLLVAFLFVVLKAYWEHRRSKALLLEQNRRLEEQRDQEKQLNEQLSQATQSKLMFFTNVSHDLRTPLTLIQGPLEELAAATNLTPAQTELVKVANRNARILHRLINQILDFRKYENGKVDLNLTEVDFGQLMRAWTESFVPLAKSRHMHLRFDFPEGVPAGSENVAIDPEKIERVVFNLISNAFKYTPANGHIDVSYRFEERGLVISVRDTGRGISVEDMPSIFQRFFQVDKVHPNGSGIGLSLAKAFVELHGGSIEVESEPGKGSVFTVLLPVRHVAAEAADVVQGITPESVTAELDRAETLMVPELPDTVDESAKKPVVLVIDDNDDMRHVVGSLLDGEFTVISAKDGREGLRLAAKYVPDLIICDVMMPVMDGLECCRHLKGEVSTSHIPVLMLTACSMDEQRVSGYDSGADGYLSKPFNNDVLRARAKSLVANRRLVRDLWRGTSPTSPARNAAEPVEQGAALPKVATDIDNDFYTRFLELFRSRMSDPEISVDSLAAELGLGRSQFYRKIKALTNYSPVELMRQLRLKQSRHLLTTTEKSISEIAYEVGFSNPAYFTKCYREAYGETPTALRERLGGA